MRIQNKDVANQTLIDTADQILRQHKIDAGFNVHPSSTALGPRELKVYVSGREGVPVEDNGGMRLLAKVTQLLKGPDAPRFLRNSLIKAVYVGATDLQ